MTLTPAQERFRAAMLDAKAAHDQLMSEGREDRAAGLEVGVDIGTSAAFLFMVNDRAYDDAANIVREAIAQATRTEP